MTDDLQPGAGRRAVLLCLAVVLAYVVVGAIAGVVWEWIWTPPQQVVQNHQLYYTDYDSLRRVFNGTGLYALVGAVASALMALAASLLARRNELLMLAAVIVGSLAAAYTMHAVGVALGPGDPAGITALAADGTQVSGQLAVVGKTAYLVWPMVSLFVLSLVFFAWPGRARSVEPDEQGAAGPPPDDAPVAGDAPSERLRSSPDAGDLPR